MEIKIIIMVVNDINDLILICWVNFWGVFGIILVFLDEVFVLIIIILVVWGGMVIFVFELILICNWL